MTTVAAALAAARVKLPASEARLLLSHVLGQSAAWLVAHDGDSLDEDQLLGFASLVARRASGEPVAYLIGYREFFGRRFGVSPAVLIPRPETEQLVELVLARVGAGSTANILDLGTGSGCIAITLALERPSARLTASDASSAALAVAASNARNLGARLRLVHSDWYSGVAGERFDLIIGNPPYIAEGDPHLARGDLRHEPRQALASGADGLEAIRIIVANATQQLAPGGSLMLEHGYDQAAAVRSLMEKSDLANIRVFPDLAGIPRISVGNLQRVGGMSADSL